MKWALTGATGFVGSGVLAAGREEGLSFKALTRRAQEPLDGVEWVQGDLDDGAALRALAQDCDGLIHIAGLTHAVDTALFEAANVSGTAHVIAAMKQAGCKRLIHISSLAAREPQLSAYGASKARSEELVQQSGLEWTIVRPPAVYGPRDRDMFELFRVARWGVIPLPPGGATSILHVEDLSGLLIRLAACPLHSSTRPLVKNVPGKRHARGSIGKISKTIYEPDDGREGGWSHKELAAAIGKAVGRRALPLPLPRRVLSLVASADQMLRGDRAKLTADRVGYMCHPNWVARFDRCVPEDIWRPRISGEAGLGETAQWYRDAGWL